ncbi:MAG TPA: restriction endonuclease [Actinomycetota bacterium]|nr:restriction endonuclease [Actinomycetota bacterium]
MAALLAAGIWYLTDNPAVGRAFLGVLCAGLLAAGLLSRLRTSGAGRRLRTLGDLLSLTPPEFEEAVAGVLASSSYRRVRLVGRAADLGVDIACFDGRGRPVVVQCKRHAPGIAVGSGEVQRFLGSITHAGAQRGIFVTTSRFSGPAIELAAQHGIELVDGEALVGMVARAGRRRRPAVHAGREG